MNPIAKDACHSSRAEIRPYLAAVLLPADPPYFGWRRSKTRTGLIHRISRTEYSFRHLGFQEYFASLAIADRPDRIEQLGGYIVEPCGVIIVLLMCQVDSSPYCEPP